MPHGSRNVRHHRGAVGTMTPPDAAAAIVQQPSDPKRRPTVAPYPAPPARAGWQQNRSPRRIQACRTRRKENRKSRSDDPAAASRFRLPRIHRKAGASPLPDGPRPPAESRAETCAAIHQRPSSSPKAQSAMASPAQHIALPIKAALIQPATRSDGSGKRCWYPASYESDLARTPPCLRAERPSAQCPISRSHAPAEQTGP